MFKSFFRAILVTIKSVYKSYVGPILASIKSENENSKYYSGLPKTQFNKDGLIIIDNFLSESECDDLVELGKTKIEENVKSGLIADDVYLNIRADTEDGIDTKVKQIFNFDKLSDKLGDEFMNKLSNTFEENLGEGVVIKTCTLQVDDPDTNTKRSWHTDKNPPPNFKAFVYLTDVQNEQQGPYCAIKGSHRWKYRRIINVIINVITKSPKLTDMHYVVGNRNDYYLAKKGTLVLSTQTLFHRGSPMHSEKTRFMLITYINSKTYDNGKPLKFW